MAGSAGFASACAAGLGASVPQPTRRVAMSMKQKHKRSGIPLAQNAPAPTILPRKDGARDAPLAYAQGFDEVFSIPTLGPRSKRQIRSPSFPGVRRISNLDGTSGTAESNIRYTILTAGGAPLE